jgi:hypothetical protein
MDENPKSLELTSRAPRMETKVEEDTFVIAGTADNHSIASPAHGGASRTAPPSLSPFPFTPAAVCPVIYPATRNLTEGLTVLTIFVSVSRQQTYARNVHKHSQTSIRTSLFCGQEYISLAQFLMQRYHFKLEPHSHQQSSSFHGGSSVPKSKDQDEFAFLYELRPDVAPKAVRIPAPFSTPKAKQLDVDHNSLLVLRGYPSPDWINFLGSRYKIDAEFFHRHLSFFPSAHGKLQRPAFQLPSSQNTIFQLSLTSAGVQDDSNYVDVHAKRVTAAADMELYLHNLSVGQDWETGNSIVRSYDVHDGQDFSIEQTATIYFGLLDAETEKWVGESDSHSSSL